MSTIIVIKCTLVQIQLSISKNPQEHKKRLNVNACNLCVVHIWSFTSVSSRLPNTYLHPPNHSSLSHWHHEICAVFCEARNAVKDGGLALSGARRVPFFWDRGVSFTAQIKLHYLHVIRGAEARRGDNGRLNDVLWIVRASTGPRQTALWCRL